jgi:hypothetical protein
VRTNHVHVVVRALTTPERIMNDLKAYASRKLNGAGLDATGRKRWSRHGSTRYLWSQEEIAARVDYTLHQQGAPMETFEGTSGDRKRSAEPRP